MYPDLWLTIPPRYGGPCDSWWTVHWPAVPLAFLEITNVTVDEGQHLVPAFEVAWPAQMACGGTLYHVRMPRTRGQLVVKSGYTQMLVPRSSRPTR